jgi:CheY-like chemotaxis protein
MSKHWLKDSDGCAEKASERPLVSIVNDDVSVRRSIQRLLIAPTSTKGPWPDLSQGTVEILCCGDYYGGMNKDWLKDTDGCAEKASEGPLVSIVDDDVSVRRSTQRLLSSSGLRAKVFASAEDFLQSGLVGETACLLLDMSMPGMNGLALQRRLAETGRQIPIVFLSARASEDEERRALQAGAAKFLHKPASKEVLLQTIRAALDGATS